MPYIPTRSWNALTCTMDGTDLYLGLKAAKDDLALFRIDDQVLRIFPLREISVVSGSPDKIPLRVYSLRDPTIIRITRIGEPPDEEGFMMVKMDFDLSAIAAKAPSHQHESATRDV